MTQNSELKNRLSSIKGKLAEAKKEISELTPFIEKAGLVSEDLDFLQQYGHKYVFPIIKLIESVLEELEAKKNTVVHVNFKSKEIAR